MLASLIPFDKLDTWAQWLMVLVFVAAVIVIAFILGRAARAQAMGGEATGLLVGVIAAGTVAIVAGALLDTDQLAGTLAGLGTALLTGAVIGLVLALITIRFQESREDVRDLIIAIEEAAAWTSDRLQFHFTPTTERGDEPDWGVIERNLRLRIFRSVGRLPSGLDDPGLRSRAIRLNSYSTNPIGLLGRVSRDRGDAVLWINDEARALTDYLESWLEGNRSPTLGPEPEYGDPHQ